MAFVTVNNFDVEHASQLAVYDNLYPEIQHINGKGVTDKYTMTSDIKNVTYIDVMRVLPYVPRFRQVGATNNGKWHNARNEGGFVNAPQSVHYTIPVDLIYDEGITITSVQDYANPVNLKAIIMGQLVKVMGMVINVVTYAKQIEGFFRNGDNFDKALTHSVGSIVAGDITAGEIADAVFAYDPSKSGAEATAPTRVFVTANNKLNDGIPEIGAFVVPMTARQGFINVEYNALMKSQYVQNASEAAARINANGYIDPFKNEARDRINESTGLCGMYDGVDLFIFNKVTKTYVYVALGILGTADDSAEGLVAVRGLLDKISGMIVYGAGTCRGIVGPNLEANKLPNEYDTVFIAPFLKMGVEVLHGATIKMIINGGANLANTWTAANIAAIMNTISFTPIDGVGVTGNGVIAGFNTGTSN